MSNWKPAALKRLPVARVRVFTYLDDREILVDTSTNRFLLSAGSFGAELEREKARQRITDAMLRKARAGHCCGGPVFGYDKRRDRRCDREALARRARRESQPSGDRPSDLRPERGRDRLHPHRETLERRGPRSAVCSQAWSVLQRTW